MPYSKTSRLLLIILLGYTSLATPDVDAQEVRPRQHEIKTEPAGAEVYLDWRLLGRTPLTLTETPPTGSLLVIVRDGFATRSRTINRPRSFYFRLGPEPQTHARRVLLRILGPESASFQELLIEELAQMDFFVHPESDVALFEQRLHELGTRAPKPLLAWAKAQFDTHSWIVVRLPGVAPELDPSDHLLLPPPSQPQDSAAQLDDADTLPSEFIPDDLTASEVPAVDDKIATIRIFDLRQGTLDEEFKIGSPNFHSTNSRRRQRAESQLAAEVASALLDWVESKLELTQPEAVTSVDLNP